MTTNQIPNTVTSFTEAPVSWNTRYVTEEGFECQLTLRGESGQEVLEKANAAITHLLENDCKPYSFNRYGGQSKAKNQTEKTSQGNNGNHNGQSWCPIHQCEMRRWEKDSRIWYSHKVDGDWCKGKA